MQIVYQDPYESLDPRFRVRATDRGAAPGPRPRLEARSGASEVARRARARGPDAAGALPRPLPARALGRPAPARRDRREPRARPRAARRRRARLDARRLGARGDPLAPRRAAATTASAMLMITHDLSTAAHYADRIAVMYLGRIVEEGPTREVDREPAAPVHARAPLRRAEARPARPRATRRSCAARRRTRSTSRPAAASTPAARWRSRSARPSIPSSGGRRRAGIQSTSPPASGSSSPPPDKEGDHGRHVGDRLEVDPFVHPVQVLAGRPVADRLALEETKIGRRARGSGRGRPPRTSSWQSPSRRTNGLSGSKE